MRLQDALFNLLQIRLVAEARPDDNAARETLDFFGQILREDHHLSHVEVAAVDETMIHVKYTADGKTKTELFDREHAERLLADIEANPKYN
ncbi:hypothetical protein SD70_04975 [Gordoniibacillus kamchatkensis]|uniref:Uncharacterized protein n=1 Tax=Gordoniibacillus kamchatkensis TaxID=1590651 RepID=A0ABR5AL09_9BACL|nr:hypothetical protein [Paenibacillus sp. VKM B-2647]KIL41726.1 hypothetical protein SD70_04975 [Paenibacillus sp. VKM B-2647]